MRHISLLFIAILSLSSSYMSAITIIPRSTRGADESLAYTTSAKSTTQTESNDDENAVNPSSSLGILDQYLDVMFPEQFVLSRSVAKDGTGTFKRTRNYQPRKQSIIIHHTAASASGLVTTGQIYAALQGIYRYHTLTKKRGDIGYNYIIDPLGNIYEGRAGGLHVAGAHARYNNIPSVGIALMGNFQIEKPTSGQIRALQSLVLDIATRYRLAPEQQIYLHKASSAYPYIQDVLAPAIIGHRHAGQTACPGEHLESLIPTLRTDIYTALKKGKMVSIKAKNPTYYRDMTTIYSMIGSTGTMYIPFASFSGTILSSPKLACGFGSGSSIIGVGCTISNDALIVKRKRVRVSPLPLFVRLGIKTTMGPPSIYIGLRVTDTSVVFSPVVTKGGSSIVPGVISGPTTIPASGVVLPPAMTKFVRAIGASDIYTLRHDSVRVLLYEVSMMPKREIRCDGCTIRDEKANVLPGTHFFVTPTATGLIYDGDEAYTDIANLVVQSIDLKPTHTPPKILNYTRAGSNGVGRNSRAGTISIQKEGIKKIGSDTVTNQYAIINQVPMDDYLAGIAESNDQEPFEKMKAMTLLAKNYVMFYGLDYHRHPSIPVGASYNAVDDARIFQKYVGAGFTSSSTKRPQALLATKDSVIVYSGSLAFLPYFSCSNGQIKSARATRGWTDTPYLIAHEDVPGGYCDTYAGHGVGLAGKGATKLANAGATMADILSFYYPGVNVEKVE